MHIAARNGLVAVTQTLLEKGASVTVIDVNGYNPALACAPNAPVADCLSMIIHIMIDSVRNGRRSDSLNFSSLNLGKNLLSNHEFLLHKVVMSYGSFPARPGPAVYRTMNTHSLWQDPSITGRNRTILIG